jgi:hypothetical protein
MPGIILINTFCKLTVTEAQNIALLFLNLSLLKELFEPS